MQEESAMKLRVQKPTDVTEAATQASELALPCVSKSSAHHHRHNRYSGRHSTVSPVVIDSVSPNVEVKHQVDPTNAVKTGCDTQTKPVRQKDTRSKQEIVCHGCGKPGHIRPNCPERVRKVKSPI